MIPIIIIGSIVLFIALLFLLREFWCWYWKINKKIALLEEQNVLLSTLNKNVLLIIENNNEIKNTLIQRGRENHIIDKMV
jgi:hypothetical protein